MTQHWPVAELDPIRRLRVMAAAVPSATIDEARVPSSLHDVWSVVSDLEGELHHLLPDVRSTRVRAHRGDHLEALAIGYLGQRARFDVILTPGWCWMQSRFLLCGFAATEEEDGTRVAFLGGVRGRAIAVMNPLLRRPAHAYARLVTRRIGARARIGSGER